MKYKKPTLPVQNKTHNKSSYLTNLKNVAVVALLNFTLTACNSTPNKAVNSTNNSTNNSTVEQFLIGNTSPDDKDGVYLLSLNHQNKSLVNHGVVAEVKGASYLALSANQNNLFTIAANKTAGVNRFSWSASQQKFLLTQTIDLPGLGSCHIALNHDESKLAVANYRSGDLHVYDVNKVNQQLTETGYFKNSPSDDLSMHQKPRMHYGMWDNTNKFLYAVDLGTDEIKVFDNNSDTFSAKVAATLTNGDGPRHLAFHPTLSTIYVLNELSSTIVAYQQNSTNGELIKIQRLTALPDGVTSKNSASAIRISADGRFLYAGIRGINAISVFSINKAGELTMIQSQSSLGDWPRDFNFSTSERYLLITNQRSNTINVLERDLNTGLLTATKMEISLPNPSNITQFIAPR